MNFKTTLWLHTLKPISHFSIVLLCFSMMVPLANAADYQAELIVSPEQCVALMQGQDCYLTIDVTWQSNTTDDICLYSSAQESAIQCWQQSKKGSLTQELTINDNVEFSLKLTSSQTVIAQSQLKMAWVYKRKGKPRMSWRKF